MSLSTIFVIFVSCVQSKTVWANTYLSRLRVAVPMPLFFHHLRSNYHAYNVAASFDMPPLFDHI